MKYLYTLAMILIVILGQPISPGRAQSDPAPSLWHLSTDEHVQNARLVQIDVVGQRIVQEIPLPSDWYIASVLWSPNMQYFSAVVQQGEGFWEADKQPTKLCLFTNTGELLRCKVLYILVLTAGAYGTKLAPVAWSSDSQFIYVAISHYDGYVDEKRHVSIYALDVPQLMVNDTVEVDLEWTAIHRWNWAPDVKRIAAHASIDISDMRRRDKLFVIDFARDPAHLDLYIPEPGGLFQWSHDQQTLLYDTYIDPNPEELEGIDYDEPITTILGTYELLLARWDEHNTLLVKHMNTPVVSGREVMPWGFSATGLTATNQITFIDRLYLTGPFWGIKIGLYMMDVNTSQIYHIYEIQDENSYLDIEDLTWAPGERYLAGSICPWLYDCRIGIWKIGYGFISVPTPYTDNRDPMWVEAGS